MERRKLCASTTFEILPLSTCTVCTVPAKILYLQWYSTDFRNLRVSPKMLRVGIWVESFKCAGILPLQCKVKTLRIDNIWNFAIFNLYTVPEKILYLQKCSTDFQNFCLSSKMLMVSIWVESFRERWYFTFAMERRKLCTSTTFEILSTFNLYTLPAKILYLQKYSTDFRNLCLQLEDVRGWTFWWKVLSAHVFYFLSNL